MVTRDILMAINKRNQPSVDLDINPSKTGVVNLSTVATSSIVFNKLGMREQHIAKTARQTDMECFDGRACSL